MNLERARRSFVPSNDKLAIVPQDKIDIGRALLRVSSTNGGAYLWIKDGKQGSFQTAREMARLVRHDTFYDEGLQDKAAKILIDAGLDSHSDGKRILDAIFNYIQHGNRTDKGVAYIHDPAGSFEAIQTARQTLKRGYGDCDDLSVLLATLLSEVGFQPRFVLARYNPNTPGYDHVYVDVLLQSGRVALDPSSRRHGSGWESPRAIEKLIYPIFPTPNTASLGALGAATVTSTAEQGAAIGLNFVPVVGPILAALVGPIVSLFSRKQQRAEETSRDVMKDQVYTLMGQIKDSVDSCQATPAQGTAAANAAIQAYYQACAQFTKASVTASCHNYGTQADAFPARLTAIAGAGVNCAGTVANQTQTQTTLNPDGTISKSPVTPGSAAVGGNSASGDSLGGLTVAGLPLTTLLLIGGGGLLLWKFLD